MGSKSNPGARITLQKWVGHTSSWKCPTMTLLLFEALPSAMFLPFADCKINSKIVSYKSPRCTYVMQTLKKPMCRSRIEHGTSSLLPICAEEDNQPKPSAEHNELCLPLNFGGCLLLTVVVHTTVSMRSSQGHENKTQKMIS